MTDANPCCPNCGRELPQTARFCTSCGASITDKPKGTKRTGTLVGKATDKVELAPAGAPTASAAESSLTLTDWDILPLDPKAPSAATAQTDGGGGLAAALDRLVESAAKKENSSAAPAKAGAKARTKPSWPKKPDKPSSEPTKETGSDKSSELASDKPQVEEKVPDKPSETPLPEPAKETTADKPSELASDKPQVEEKAAANTPPPAQDGAQASEKAASQPPSPPSSSEHAPSNAQPGDGARGGTSDSSKSDRPSEGAKNVSSLDAPLDRPSPTEDSLGKQSSQPAEEHKASPASARGKDNQMASINPSVQEKRTIVEEGTVLKGSLESACPVVVHGRIEGDVQAPSLTVSATGMVEGRVRVDTIECDGQLAGEIDAERVELAGAVKNNTVIRAATIQMKLTDKSGKKQIVFGGSEGAANATASTGGKESKDRSDAASKGKTDGSEGAAKKGEASPEQSGGGSGKKRDS